MDRRETLLQLAQQLGAATAAADWAALAALNTVMASTLPELAARGAWTPAERSALAALREAHLAAVAKVDGAAAGMRQHLQDMTNNREGWLAYALDSGDAATGT